MPNQPNKAGKFINSSDKRIRRPRDPPIDLNTQSHNGLSLVDINIPNSKEPKGPIYEPPINDDPPMRDPPNNDRPLSRDREPEEDNRPPPGYREP